MQLRLRSGVLGVGISYSEDVEYVEKSREDCDILRCLRWGDGKRVVSKAAAARAYIIGQWMAPLEPARTNVVTAQGFNYPKHQVCC